MLMLSLSFVFIVLVSTAAGQTTTTSSPLACTSRYGLNKLAGQCMNITSCTGAALRGNCANAAFTCCVTDNPANPPAVAENQFIKKATFLKLVGNTIRNNALYNYFARSMVSAGINNQNKAAAYLATLVGESDYFTKLESAAVDNSFDADLGNNATGDGENYQARGALLLRGKENYILAQARLSSRIPYNLVLNPERVAFPSIAFEVAAWFWQENAFIIRSNNKATKGNLNELADGTFHNFTLLTHSLTNNIEKLKSRASFNELVLNEINYPTMKRGQGIACEINGEVGNAIPICLLDFKKPYCGCEGTYDMRSCPYGFSNGKCRNSAIIKCCVERCKSSLDLVILMDSSGSIGGPDFVKEQDFVIALLDNLKLGPDDTRVSIMHYNSEPYLLVDFLNFTDYNTTVKAIKDIKYVGGGTFTHLALKKVNEYVLQENRGMRPIELAIPKVVIVLTDGASQSYPLTIAEANRIKMREFSIISVGVGSQLNIKELIDMASTPNDQYLVENFNQISLILASLAKSTCQQPAQIITETEVKTRVEKDSYKYYKFSLLEETSQAEANKTYLEKFTIELDEFKGQCKLFFSFTDENPKGAEDFIGENDITPEKDQNFVERSSPLRLKREALVTPSKTTRYQIERPSTGQNEVVYFSVKGYKDDNEFQVYIYNRTVESKNGGASPYLKLSSSFYLFSLFLTLILCNFIN